MLLFKSRVNGYYLFAMGKNFPQQYLNFYKNYDCNDKRHQQKCGSFLKQIYIKGLKLNDVLFSFK